MKDGYQIVEPEDLRCLFGNPLHFEFAVAVFSWLIPKINLSIGVLSSKVTIEIIRANYLGSYPVLGVKYSNPEVQDVGPLIESAVSRILRENSAFDFIVEAAASKASWAEVARHIMAAAE